MVSKWMTIPLEILTHEDSVIACVSSRRELLGITVFEFIRKFIFFLENCPIKHVF